MIPSGELQNGGPCLVPGFPKPGAPFRILHLPSKSIELPRTWQSDSLKDKQPEEAFIVHSEEATVSQAPKIKPTFKARANVAAALKGVESRPTNADLTFEGAEIRPTATATTPNGVFSRPTATAATIKGVVSRPTTAPPTPEAVASRPTTTQLSRPIAAVMKPKFGALPQTSSQFLKPSSNTSKSGLNNSTLSGDGLILPSPATPEFLVYVRMEEKRNQIYTGPLASIQNLSKIPVVRSSPTHPRFGFGDGNPTPTKMFTPKVARVGEEGIVAPTPKRKRALQDVDVSQIAKSEGALGLGKINSATLLQFLRERNVKEAKAKTKKEELVSLVMGLTK